MEPLSVCQIDLTEAVEVGFGRQRTVIWMECLRKAKKVIKDRGLPASSFKKAVKSLKNLQTMGDAKSSDQRDVALSIFKYHYENCLGREMSFALAELFPFAIPDKSRLHSGYVKNSAALLSMSFSDLQNSKSLLLMSFPVAAISGIVETLEDIVPSRKCDWWSDSSGGNALIVRSSALDFIIGDGSGEGESSKAKAQKKWNQLLIFS